MFCGVYPLKQIQTEALWAENQYKIKLILK